MFGFPKYPRLFRRLAALFVGVGMGLAGCAGNPAADWQLRASAAASRATSAFLNAEFRAFEAEFAESLLQASRAAQPTERFRVILLKCALQVSVLNFADCSDSEKDLQPQIPSAQPQDTSMPLLAYADYLAGRRLGAEQIALLPPAQQPIARELARMSASAERSSQVALDRAVASVADPLSQLVASGVAVRAGYGSPAIVASAVRAASAQGWRAPLEVWLTVQVKVAEQSGDQARAAQARQRLKVLNAGSAGSALKP